MSAGARHQCFLSARPCHSPRSVSIGVEHDRGLLDSVHGAALAPVRLGHLGVAGAALDRDDRHHGAAAAHPGVEPGGLAADAGVGAHAVLRRRQAAGARRLLVGVGAVDDVAAQLTPARCSVSRANSMRGQAALHVVDAAAHRAAVLLDDLERIVFQSSGGPGVTASMWPFSSSERPPPRARQAGGKLGPALEVEIVRHEAVARAGRVGFPEVDVGADTRSRAASVCCRLRLVVRRGRRPCARWCCGTETSSEDERGSSFGRCLSRASRMSFSSSVSLTAIGIGSPHVPLLVCSAAAATKRLTMASHKA